MKVEFDGGRRGDRGCSGWFRTESVRCGGGGGASSAVACSPSGVVSSFNKDEEAIHWFRTESVRCGGGGGTSTSGESNTACSASGVVSSFNEDEEALLGGVGKETCLVGEGGCSVV